VLWRGASGRAVDRRRQGDDARDLNMRSVAVSAALLAATVAVAMVGSACTQSTATGPASTGDPVAGATDGRTPQTAVAEAPRAVHLLGGSSARECIVSNAGWADAIARHGGPLVRTRNLGASYQTFARDAQLVAAMPRGPTLVLIGINVGRFTAEPKAAVTAPSPSRRRRFSSRIFSENGSRATSNFAWRASIRKISYSRPPAVRVDRAPKLSVLTLAAGT